MNVIHSKTLNFRRNEIYSLSWSNDIDLDKLSIVTASFGGPIGFCLNILF
jgi:hypothetical protein